MPPSAQLPAGPSNWQGIFTPLKSGRGLSVQISEADRRLSFRRLVELLPSNTVFALFFHQALATALRHCRPGGETGIFWEMPPLRRLDLERPFECVVLPAEKLDRVKPQPQVFKAYYTKAGSAAVSFDNLGGDARLVVPVPTQPSGKQAFAHLGAFLTSAKDSEAVAVWRLTGQQLATRLGERPVWVSTSGLGVYWLHIRLDQRPKYYQYEPYRH